MSDGIDPSALFYHDNYNGEQYATTAERIKVSEEFARVMGEAGLQRDEMLEDYNRTSGKGLTISPESTFQRHQAENAQDARALMRAECRVDCDQPFSAEMSALLMIPRTVPDDFGDAGPATV